MRSVLFYINSLTRGGAERVFSSLANRFAKDGFNVTFVTSFRLEDEYSLCSSVKRISLEENKIVDTLYRKNISLITSLRHVIKNVNPDIVLTASPECNFRGILACMGLSSKSIVSIISDCNNEYSSKIYRFLAKTLYNFSSGIVCQTKEQKKWFPKQIQKKCVILFNSVDESFFKVKQSSFPKNLISVGRLIPLKNHKDIINAYSLIYNKIEDDLVILGDGQCKEKLEEMIKAKGLENRIHLLGAVSNVAEHLSNSKAYIHASSIEGLPNAVMEAMTVGLPCICADCSGGGVAELLGNNKNGLVFPVGDTAKLSGLMLDIVKNNSLRESLSCRAKQKATDFEGEKVYKNWNFFLSTIAD